MARKSSSKTVNHHCKDCKHSFDHYSMNYRQEPVLCKCPFQKHSKLLNHDWCEKFAMKQICNAKIR